MRAVLLALLLGFTTISANAGITSPVVESINSLGINLLRAASATNENFLISPYSIQSGLAMVYAGAAGQTRDEMRHVLGLPESDALLHTSFAALRKYFEEATARSITNSDSAFVLHTANRLFPQKGYLFDSKFLELTRDDYGAPLLPLDFAGNPNAAAKEINTWIEAQTNKRIRDVVSAGALKDKTMVIVNSIYLKARWAEEFSEHATKPQPFHVAGKKVQDVPMMKQEQKYGYLKGDGFQAVTLPYEDGDCHFLILLPDAVHGLGDLEKNLTTDTLEQCARLPERDVILYLPKFRIEPPALNLSEPLAELGMKLAFDSLKADFSRMTAQPFRNPLFVSEVIHKAFLSVDEEGTEAAALNYWTIDSGAYGDPPKPVEVKVDRPFLFAIQHRTSTACLFFGRIVDPR